MDSSVTSEGVTPSQVDTTSASLLRLYVFFLLMFQTLFKLSDTAVSALLLFLSMFFKTISRSLKVIIPEGFLLKLPRNVYRARMIASNGTNRSDFTQYICCPTCHSIYIREECITTTESKKCNYVKFPNHPQSQHRSQCGTVLIKTVKTQTGKYVLQPKLIYCYRSVIDSLKEMVKRQNFIEQCEEWRN